MPLTLPGIVSSLVALPFPFRLGVKAGKPGEAHNQTANRGAARRPVTGEVIEPRTVHVVLHSSATRPFVPLQCGRRVDTAHP